MQVIALYKLSRLWHLTNTGPWPSVTTPGTGNRGPQRYREPQIHVLIDCYFILRKMRLDTILLTITIDELHSY